MLDWMSLAMLCLAEVSSMDVLFLLQSSASVPLGCSLMGMGVIVLDSLLAGFWLPTWKTVYF